MASKPTDGKSWGATLKAIPFSVTAAEMLLSNYYPEIGWHGEDYKFVEIPRPKDGWIIDV